MQRTCLVALVLLGCVNSLLANEGPPAWQFWRQPRSTSDSVSDFANKIGSSEGAKSLWSTLKEKTKDIETPGIRWNLHPQKTVLKLRKRFTPLGLTKLCIGADFDPQERTWRLQTSWVDKIIGGDINLQGSEVSVSKDFSLDGRSSLWLRAAYDWRTKKSLIGFKLRPIQGFSHGPGDSPTVFFRKPFSINDNLKVEIGTNLELPEAAYTMGSDGKMSLGMGDFFVDLRELNLILEV